MALAAHLDTGSVDSIVEYAESLYRDSSLSALRSWHDGGGKVVGCVPAYVPAEIIEAAGALPAWLLGAGPSLEVVQGDAYFQSAICHLPRSLVDLGLRGRLDAIDLLVVPSTCDVLRNLTGMWQLIWPDRRVRFLDLPHRDDEVGFAFYRRELQRLAWDVEEATGLRINSESLREAIRVGNRRRRVLALLEEMRTLEPWRVSTSELWLVVRAGAVLPAAQHVELLEAYRRAVAAVSRPVLDVARVVLSGAFCEQPPLGFLRTLERAGCAIVADDLLIGMRWFAAPIDEHGDPLDALARAYLVNSPPASCRFEGRQDRASVLVNTVRGRGASGVIYATPSFCDPALLDRPVVLQALDRAGVPCVQLQYAENSADFGSVREQAGTFADALRLWEAS